MQVKVIGRYKDVVTYLGANGSTVRVDDKGWRYNQVQDSALKIIMERISGSNEIAGGAFEDYLPIKYVGFGTGTSSAKPFTQELLETEVYRLQLVTSGDTFKFLDPATGNELNPQVTSRRFKVSLTLGANDANGNVLTEFGLFGGDATNIIDTGYLFNWITHDPITKDPSIIIERTVDITIDIDRT